MTGEPTLVLGYDNAPVRELGQLLGGRLETVPERAGDREPERWRSVVAAGELCERIVVALWNHPPGPEALHQIDDESWRWRSEAQFIAWAIALGAASLRCAEGGAIVAVAEAPALLDSAGWVVETGLACGVGALVKSLAFSEGPRAVRVNAVTTSARLSGPDTAAPAPPLASFPGRLDTEVVGAIRLLLSDEAVGLTGRILASDCGRSPADVSPADLRTHLAVSVRGTWLLAQASFEPLRASRGTMATRILGRNPLRRLGDPVTEIGAAARFLLSDDASYITGHTLMVDGGSCPAT